MANEKFKLLIKHYMANDGANLRKGLNALTKKELLQFLEEYKEKGPFIKPFHMINYLD